MQHTFTDGNHKYYITAQTRTLFKLQLLNNEQHTLKRNNRAERAVKPFVIGRKNWMFSNTANGADASAMLYSIIETAKANGLIPFDYISHYLAALSEDSVDIEKLLPWNFKLYSV